MKFVMFLMESEGFSLLHIMKFCNSTCVCCLMWEQKVQSVVLIFWWWLTF